jgi:hypothetical protein
MHVTADRRSEDPRRAGARILDTAEGVLIGLRRCSLNQAFVEIAQTAKRHNLSTLSLADALVALAQNQPTDDLDPTVVATARQAWEQLLEGRQCDGACAPSAMPANVHGQPPVVDDDHRDRFHA